MGESVCVMGEPATVIGEYPSSPTSSSMIGEQFGDRLELLRDVRELHRVEGVEGELCTSSGHAGDGDRVERGGWMRVVDQGAFSKVSLKSRTDDHGLTDFTGDEIGDSKFGCIVFTDVEESLRLRRRSGIEHAHESTDRKVGEDAAVRLSSPLPVTDASVMPKSWTEDKDSTYSNVLPDVSTPWSITGENDIFLLAALTCLMGDHESNDRRGKLPATEV